MGTIHDAAPIERDMADDVADLATHVDAQSFALARIHDRAIARDASYRQGGGAISLHPAEAPSSPRATQARSIQPEARST